MQLMTVDLSNVQSEEIPWLNKAYDLWYEVNAPTVASIGEALKPDAFFRAKICLILRDEDRVIGLSLSNFLDFRIQAIQHHTYLDITSEMFRKRMLSQRKRVYTIEWVTVDPKFRASVSGTQTGHVMLGLSMYTMRDLGFDCYMGFSRTDWKIDKTVELFGGRRVELTQRFNTECGVMVGDRDSIKLHPRSDTQGLIDQIWSQAVQLNKGRKVVTAA